MDIPRHFRNFPCMKPRIGRYYEHPRHKRLLVVGESHYLPEDSTLHSDADAWYRCCQEDLTHKEKYWISTEKIITDSLAEGFSIRAHGIFRNIAAAINRCGPNLEDPNYAIEHVAYCNFFLRPAKKGRSLKDDIVPLDIKVATQALKWIIDEYSPDLVICCSILAGSSAQSLLRSKSLAHVLTPHPTCKWWNVGAKRYGIFHGRPQKGRDLVTRFLREQQWHS